MSNQSPMHYPLLLNILLGLTALGLSPLASSATVHIAVASNFSNTIKSLITPFEKQSGNSVIASYGSSGQLYAQIRNGAPYEVFLSADQLRPNLLIQDGYADSSNGFIYAQGQIVLWSPNKTNHLNKQTLISERRDGLLAIANPKHAPYGSAAIQILKQLNVYQAWKKRLITGQNIAQTQQFIASKNVSFGFICYSQVAALPPDEQGAYWLVPTHYYKPLLQQLVILKKGQHNPAALRFIKFLKSPQAQAIILRHGYLPGPMPP